MQATDDDRVRCLDCRHLWPVLRTTARCEEPRRAGLRSCWLTLEFTEQPQRCPGFAPTIRSPPSTQR